MRPCYSCAARTASGACEIKRRLSSTGEPLIRRRDATDEAGGLEKLDAAVRVGPCAPSSVWTASVTIHGLALAQPPLRRVFVPSSDAGTVVSVDIAVAGGVG